MTSCKPSSEAPSCGAGSVDQSGGDSVSSFASDGDESYVDLYAVIEGRARIKPIKGQHELGRRSAEETRSVRNHRHDHNSDVHADEGHGGGDGHASGQRRRSGRSDRQLSSIPSERRVEHSNRQVASDRKLTSDPSRRSVSERQNTSDRRRDQTMTRPPPNEREESDKQQHRPSRPASERQHSAKERARRLPERQDSADSDRRRPSNERQSSGKEYSAPPSNERNDRPEQKVRRAMIREASARSLGDEDKNQRQQDNRSATTSDINRRADSKQRGGGELLGRQTSHGRLQGHSRESGKEETRKERPEPPKMIRRAPGGGDLMLSRQSSHGRLQGHGIVRRESRPKPPSDPPRPIEDVKPFVRMSRRRSMGDVSPAERIQVLQVQQSFEPEPQPRRPVATKNRPDSPPLADQRPTGRMQRRGSMGDVPATPCVFQHPAEVLTPESRGRMPRRGSTGGDSCAADRVRPSDSSHPPEPSCAVEKAPERPTGRMSRRNSTNAVPTPTSCLSTHTRAVSQKYVDNLFPTNRPTLPRR